MARSLTLAVQYQTLSATCAPIYFVEIDFGPGVLNLWTGQGDLSWDSKTWLGNGYLRAVSGMGEVDDLTSPNCEIELAGVPQALLSLVLNLEQGKSVKVWLGFLNSSGAVIADPYNLWVGKTDVAVIKESADGALISLQCENSLVQTERVKAFRYNPDSQKLFYPNDLGFNFAASTARQDLFWGNAKKDTRAPETNRIPKSPKKQGRGR